MKLLGAYFENIHKEMHTLVNGSDNAKKLWGVISHDNDLI